MTNGDFPMKHGDFPSFFVSLPEFSSPIHTTTSFRRFDTNNAKTPPPRWWPGTPWRWRTRRCWRRRSPGLKVGWLGKTLENGWFLSHDGSMVLLFLVTFSINIAQILAYIPAPWILWVLIYVISIDFCDFYWFMWFDTSGDSNTMILEWWVFTLLAKLVRSSSAVTLGDERNSRK